MDQQGQRTASGQTADFKFCHRLQQRYGLPNGNSQGKGHPGNQRSGILQPRPMTGQEKHSPPSILLWKYQARPIPDRKKRLTAPQTAQEPPPS